LFGAQLILVSAVKCLRTGSIRVVTASVPGS
jgi:hypothetical protein